MSLAFTGQMLHHFALRVEKSELMAGILTNELQLLHAAAR